MGASYFRFWSRAETAMHGPRPLITSTTIVFTFQNFFPRNDNFIFFFTKFFFELKKKKLVQLMRMPSAVFHAP